MNLLINPTEMEAFGQTPPPLGLLYMASMAKTKIYDAAMLHTPPDQFIYKSKPKILGVTVYTSVRHDALRILSVAKESGAITVAGGPHVGTCWRQMAKEYPFIDHFVIGDGELAWKSLCRGKKMKRIINMPVLDLDELPLPAWNLIDLSQYPSNGKKVHNGNNLSILPRVSVVLGRGCNGSCSFCSTWWVNGRYRSHGNKWMHRHLDLLWNRGARHLVFQDDCLTVNRNAIIELCKVMKSYSFSWSGTTRADAIDDELAKEMAEAGCYKLKFGVESGSSYILKLMRKKIQPEQVIRARRICKNHGISFVALMMFSYPYETDKDRVKSFSLIDELQPDEWSSYDETFILPGTELYRDCKKRKIVDDSFWAREKSPFFLLDGLRFVKNCSEVTDISNVVLWGPSSTKVGNSFNPQPNETSAFWFKLDKPLSNSQHIMIGDIILPTMRVDLTASAAFPHKKLFSMIDKPGTLKLYIFDGIRRVKQFVGDFEIVK